MSARIHPSAIVDPAAQLGADVVVGPWAMIGPHCTVGDGSVIETRAVLEEHVHLGPRVTVGIGSVLGGKPQDLKFKGEVTTVEIGEGTTIREYATINRGTSESHKTTVGRNCFLMSYVHLAHDCHIGDGVIISVHQFVKIGKHSMISGGSLVRKDVPPYTKAAREPLSYEGVNSVGLRRRGFSNEQINAIQDIYRILFVKGYNTATAIKLIETEIAASRERDEILQFVRESDRGIMKGYITK